MTLLNTLLAWISAAIALISVCIAAASLARTRRLDKRQDELSRKQEELTDLQLQLLKRENKKQTAMEQADVRVSLEGWGSHHQFVVANWGHGPARNVDFKLQKHAGRSSPLVKGDYDEKLPIRELLPGDGVRFMAALTFDTGTIFDAVLTWTEADGSEKRHELQVAAT